MKQKKIIIDDVLENIEYLEDLLTDRITDLHQVKGGMQARHAYILYRKVIWDIRDGVKQLKQSL